VGSQGRTRDAVFLGSVVTLTHTGSVIALGLLTLLASHYILPSLIAPWLEVISGLLVIGFGINLFLQRRGALSAWLAARREKQPARFTIQLQTAQLAGPRPAGPLSPGHSHEHAHDALPHTQGAHTHSHALPPAGQVTMKSLVTLGISGGLVPCPDAIAILLVAVALNRIPLGMLLILAFSIGLAFVLIGIGIAMVQGARLIGHNDLFNRFSLFTPLISAIVVFGLGIGLTLNALTSFNLASAASLPNPVAGLQKAPGSATPLPAFDIRHAGLVYLAPDARRQNQLTLMPLSGGSLATYTQETAGVAGYALSPDRKLIIYTVIRFDGSSSLWGIDVDGTHRHLVLDCPQAECAGPVWYPDGTKLVYERLNNPQSSTLAVFSLWWLDLATGQTRPVFQDQAFPGIAPGFSPDGQWLSYISPLNNTIQLYNLKGDRSTSIPLSRNYQPRIAQPWDPAGGSLLFWDAPSADQTAALRLKRYDLATGRSIDPGGPGTQVEFETAWSPDGQWIAITRDASSPGQPNQRQEIWLVRPDGSQGHTLVNEKQVSYSNLAWSPDGRFLAYCRYSTVDAGNPEIWLADLAGGQQTRLVTGGILPVLLPGP
jgi:ABC-type nickel/cobalt efflux system permease component RcnA/Tol biopolymer transport system component